MKLKERCALLTYWLLLILLPSAVFAFPFRGSVLFFLVGIFALIAFIRLGRKGYPEWKKIWKVK